MSAGGRVVRVEGPGGLVCVFPVSGEDTAVVLVDGAPALGVDARGFGHWHDDGETWARLLGEVVERDATVLGMSEQQFHDLLAHLGLPPTWWGRWKGAPGEPRDISLSPDGHSCGNTEAFIEALAWVHDQGLTYQQTSTMRYPAGG